MSLPDGDASIGGDASLDLSGPKIGFGFGGKKSKSKSKSGSSSDDSKKKKKKGGFGCGFGGDVDVKAGSPDLSLSADVPSIEGKVKTKPPSIGKFVK